MERGKSFLTFWTYFKFEITMHKNHGYDAQFQGVDEQDRRLSMISHSGPREEKEKENRRH